MCKKALKVITQLIVGNRFLLLNNKSQLTRTVSSFLILLFFIIYTNFLEVGEFLWLNVLIVTNTSHYWFELKESLYYHNMFNIIVF